MAQKLKNGPQSRAPLRWGEGAKNITASRHLRCPNNVPCNTQSEEETGEKGERLDRKVEEREKRGRLGIGTWNVRTLNEGGKLEGVKREMKRCGLNVLGVSEVRWKGQGDCMSDGVRIIYSGGEECQRGVAIMCDEEVSRRVTEVQLCNDRLIMIKISAMPVDIVVIQVYMPTTEHEDEEIEEMYDQIDNIINKQKGDINVIVMGDFNASVGEGSDDEKVIGKYGLGKRNDRGQMLIEFCKKNKLVVTNTWFQQEKRRRYTWKNPGDTERYQIDYILVKQRYRNGVKCCKTYPGADAFTDHNLVAMKMFVRLKRLKRAKRKQKWDIEYLKRNSGPFQRSVENAVKSNSGMDINERWIELKRVIHSSAQQQIGRERKKKIRKPWVTKDMISKMDERREWKSKNNEEGKVRYRQLNNDLRREVAKAKEAWWNRECDELEELNSKGRSDLVYAKVAKLTWKKKAMIKNVSIEDNAGTTITEPEAVRETWRMYIESLYDKDGKPKIEDLQVEDEGRVEEDEKGPSLLKSEILSAISEMKEGKAAGVDEIPAEMLKCLGEKALQEVCDICQNMYEEGKWPDDFTRATIIPLPKKNNAVKCSDFRTISLICHASKIMLRVLTKRIESKAKHLLGRNQFGFRKGCGTRDAIGVLRTLCERSMEHGNEVYICFVDFEKAFDRVEWVKMFEILKDLHIDWKDRRLLQDLYMRQEAVIRIADGESDPGTIGRGVRQGCPISPLLFSIYAEVMMIEALENIEEGIIVGGQLLSDIRFADDQGMVASTEMGLQKLMDKLNDTAKKFNMKINVQKTKTMVVCRDGGGVVNISIDGQRIEQVGKFKYLGSIISEDGRSLIDIKARIAMAKDAFNKRKELLTKGLSRALKKRMIKVLIWPVVLYGCETWTLLAAGIDKLEALEMWLWRKIEKVNWSDKVRNEVVLKRVDENRCLMRTIRQRKKNWIGHVLRGHGLMKDVLEGRMLGKRRVGKPRIGMIDDIMEGSFVEMKRRAEGREEWKKWVPTTCR